MFHPTFLTTVKYYNAKNFFIGQIVSRNTVHFYRMLTSRNTFELAIQMKKAKKIKVFSVILLAIFFFIIAADEIIRRTNAEEFCILINISLFVIDFGSGLCSSFLCFFIFFAKFIFYQ